MMDEEDGVVNRRKKKTGGKPRKAIDQRPLVEAPTGVVEAGDEEGNYLTVTSVDLRNWFKGFTGRS